jgi:hypothetical protein
LHVIRQSSDAIVDVRDWMPDEKYPVFPLGSKPKRALLCPDAEFRPFLKPGHRYLFKAADGWQAQQLWSEVIAYEMARPLGLKVPPAFVAFDSTSGTAGVLVEFFYGYPGTVETTRFVHAADFMQDHFAHQKKGRPHALRENLALCRKFKVTDRVLWWAQALIFDTLIGNVDRHSENWGFLFQWHQGAMNISLAPLYDNGTSLGYGITDANLQPGWDSTKMNAFIARGRHDCGWSRDEDGPMGHIALTSRFITAHRAVAPEARTLLSLPDATVEEVAAWCEAFALPRRFSAARADFVVKQVIARREALLGAIGL